MRSKEDAQDYRYFPDPDLLPLVVTEKMIEDVRKTLPELPYAKAQKYQRELALSAYDANLLTESREKAEFFELTLNVLKKPSAKTVANWVNGELSAIQKNFGVGFLQLPISGKAFAGLLDRILDGTISANIAKEVLQEMIAGSATADEIVEKRGLKQISDAGAIEKLVDEAIAAGAKQVEDYRAGKEKALQSLVGQVMKASQGKANPAQVNEILRRKLSG
jgi:aspartyl-tRNA(Asn)/glutamyl-tRNA(Gln) amidotransferase subunit B